MQHTNHTYQNRGTFQISLHVKDNNGCTDTKINSNAVSVHKPTANFTADNLFSCEDTLTTNFQNSSTGANLTNFYWNFGNGQTSNIRNPTHSYTQSGEFDVSLIVKDTYGCYDTIIKADAISLQKVKSDFVNYKYTCKNQYIEFYNNSENASNFLWDFGNGQTSNLFNPTHIYSDTGYFSIKLIALNEYGCADTITYPIYVDYVKANFEVDKNFSCFLPDTFYYLNKSENATYFYWNFGNGNYSNEENPTNIVSAEGIYDDVLLVTSEHGCMDSFKLDSNIIIQRPQARFLPNNLEDPFGISGCVPLTVNFFDATTYQTDKDVVVSWFWEFGDGFLHRIYQTQLMFSKLLIHLLFR
jgi:PKD repeat protein